MTPQYNAFEHLRQSLFLAFDDLMSMLTIYCDESGTDRKNRVAAVGGYIGQVVQWQRFEREWSKILNKPCYGVAMLHRSDLETWHGEFTEKRGWNPNRRGALLNELHRIIKLRTKVAIGSAVIKEDWESVMPNWVKKSFGGVYGWCAHECIVAARHWCERPIRRYQHPINWVFECGAEGWTQVAQMLTELAANPALKKQFRIGSWTFSGKDVIPLQAADTIAYEIFKQVENQILDHGDKHNVRFSMQNLIRPQDSHYLKYWNKERLREWLQNTMTAHYRVI